MIHVRGSEFAHTNTPFFPTKMDPRTCKDGYRVSIFIFIYLLLILSIDSFRYSSILLNAAKLAIEFIFRQYYEPREVWPEVKNNNNPTPVSNNIDNNYKLDEFQLSFLRQQQEAPVNENVIEQIDELESYLNLDVPFEPDNTFEILKWWKNKETVMLSLCFTHHER